MTYVNIYNSSISTAAPLYQYDYGQRLEIRGLDVETVEVQFSLQETGGETISRFASKTDDVLSVAVPDELLGDGHTMNYSIYAFIYVTEENSGKTVYKIRIPIKSRPKPTEYSGEEESQKTILDEIIQKVNQIIQNGGSGSGTIGKDGREVELRKTDDSIEWRYTDGEWQTLVSLDDIRGRDGIDGKDGLPGKDGKDGIDGKDGLPGKDGKDGLPGANGENGKDGKDGYTPVKGVDYFDGLPGKDGAKGDPGEKGADGSTPSFTIGSVETLDAGSNATASITGDAENPVLNLGIPKGQTGTGGKEKKIKLLADYTLTEPVAKIVLNTDIEGKPWNISGNFYYFASIKLTNTTVKKTLGVTSNGDVQKSGPVCPSNISNFGGTKEVLVTGKLERVFENYFSFVQQANGNVKNLPGALYRTNTIYGGFSAMDFFDINPVSPLKDLRFVLLGNGDLDFDTGTNIKVWCEEE